MEICKADFEDLNKILELQYLAYQSEAALFGTSDIPPLKQTMEEVIQEYGNGIILKMISEDDDIIGSVRAREDNGTAYIGKLMVHPDYRGRGYGTKLLSEIEKCYPQKRYELFTSTRSEANIRLYQRNGYRIFDQKPVNDDLVFVYMEKTCDSDKAEVILKTERLFLRKMNMGDFDALYQILADPDIMQHYPYAFDEIKVRDWIKRNKERYCKDGFGLWAVCLKDTGEVIGDCGLTMQDIEGEILPEIGYHIRRDCQCRGYAKEAASAVRDWAFKNTDYPALYSYCKYTNAASIRTAEAIGMKFDREYPDAVNGITHISVIYRRDTIMNDYIAYCGLDCETCEARLATAGNDDELRIKVSKEWSELNGVEITPEMINCSGCRIPGAKTVYCDSLCPIRQCAREKQVETCGCCPEMESCEKVGAIIGNNPDARGRLENAGSV